MENKRYLEPILCNDVNKESETQVTGSIMSEKSGIIGLKFAKPIPLAERCVGRREEFLAGILRGGLLFVLLSMIFGDGMFRIPGVGKDAGGLGLALSAIRGLIFFSNFGVYAVLIFYFLVVPEKVRRFPWIELWPVLLLIAFVGGMALLSSARSTVNVRVGNFLLYALPAMVSMLHCTDRKGIELVRDWIVGAAGLAIAILIASGRFIPLILGDMRMVNAVPDEVAEELAERFVLQSDPITTAMMFYLAGLAGLSLLFDLKRWYTRTLVLAIILVSVGLALTTGARGPLLAFIIGVVSLVALARFSIRRRLLTGVLGCLLFSSALVVLPEVSPESGRRVFGLLGQVIPSLDKYGTGAAKLEADGRHERFEEAISAPLSLFGRGVGAYGERVGDPTEYIHNLFLEAYYETGLAGIAVISFVFLYCCTELLRFSIKGRKLAQFCFGSMVFYLVDAQFTGTLIDNVGSLSFLVLGFMAIGVEKRLERLAKANAKSGIDAKGGVRNGFNRRCHNLR